MSKINAKEKWKLSNKSISILKAIGVSKINADSFDDVFEKVKIKVISRIPDDEKEEVNQTKEQSDEITDYDAVLDELEDHEDSLDYDYINQKLNEK